MSLTDESTVAERLAYADRIQAEARLFAAKIKHKNREYRRTRLMAAMLVSEAIGTDYSEEQLRKSGCLYIRVGKVPLYRDADLQELSESILDRALKRGHGAQAPPATPIKEISNEAVVRRGKRRPRSRKPTITANSDVVA
jgi:hypothetical protein